MHSNSIHEAHARYDVRDWRFERICRYCGCSQRESAWLRGEEYKEVELFDRQIGLLELFNCYRRAASYCFEDDDVLEDEMERVGHEFVHPRKQEGMASFDRDFDDMLVSVNVG